MNRFINKTVRWISAIVAASVLFGACSEDDVANRLGFDTDHLFFNDLGEIQTISFWSETVTRIEATSIPVGWTVKADFATKTVSITAPANLDDVIHSVRSGAVVITGYSSESGPVIARLFVAVADQEDLSSVRSNSYIVSNPYTVYSFDATHKGESSETIAPADVRIVWQTDSEMILYPVYKNGTFSFYVDGKDASLLTPGNVLVGAYDGDGSLLWSWHLWLVKDGVVTEQTYANGKIFMSLNLGALGNSNKTTTEILSSYGMFYQWGRRVPFVGPNAYNAAKGEDHYIYDAEGRRIKIEYVASDSQTGTTAYASANPLHYILGAANTTYDWLYGNHSDALWADQKTMNDPCPKGWRVPSKSDFAGLSIVDMTAGRENQFGWELTDGTVTAYYPGAGFRTYLNGRIQNVYNPIEGVEVPKPWVGYYWTTGMDGTNSAAMYFWLNAADPLQSGIQSASAQYRANGMQIRCVKE